MGVGYSPLSIYILLTLGNTIYFIRGKLYDLSCESWNNELDEDIRQKMASMATSAAWGLGKTIVTHFVNPSTQSLK